ncbi:MAG: non-homologous end-joining DNA ligase [Candidatus Aenigmarchaeota archaeon]|nr:non-homologous end-joining DNA ligase [Candidatus Aenigmarchaeota archaeon]
MDLFEIKIKPMLAFSSEPFNSKDYYFEIKFDGTRALAYIDVENRSVKLLNRREIWFQERYPELKDIWKNVTAKKVILDGEIVVMENGKPNFYLLEEREHIDNKIRIEILSKIHPATYIVFDILFKDGNDLTTLPLSERRKILEECVKEDNNLVISEIVEEKGIEFFEKVKEMGLEGIMAKKKDSPYLIGKRSRYWLKVKALKTIDAIICGYTKGEGKREPYFGALLLGIYNEGKLRYIGRVGTGNWSEERLKEIKETLDKIKIEKNPFDIFEEEPSILEKTIFVKPKFVAEISFLEWTSDRKLRAPSFKRLRMDKEPRECKI